eukprot:1712023-Amphidinium_carterae.1
MHPTLPADCKQDCLASTRHVLLPARWLPQEPPDSLLPIDPCMSLVVSGGELLPTPRKIPAPVHMLSPRSLVGDSPGLIHCTSSASSRELLEFAHPGVPPLLCLDGAISTPSRKLWKCWEAPKSVSSGQPCRLLC